MFEKHIDTIFTDISSRGILETESKYFGVAKNRCLSTCSHFYPLLEFLNDDDRADSFVLATSYLTSWTFFLDDAIDYSTGLSQKIRANQVSSFLLLRYYDWLKEQYQRDAANLFNEYFINYSQYLITEKKWEYPELYLQEYGQSEKIFHKASICLFPIELMILEGKNYSKTIKELFQSYFSVLLLGDDLVDLEVDINSKCLTYPIIRFYDSIGELPKCQNDLEFIKPEFLITLNDFVQRIDKIKHSTDWKLEFMYNDIEKVFLSLNEKKKRV